MRKLSRRPRARSSQGDTRPFEGRRTVNLHAAGVDIGAHEIMAGVPDGDDQQLGRAFGTDTAALEALADWFLARGRQTAAMASTGVEWLPRFEPLEAHGLPGCLRSAPALKHGPGRQSEVLDCQGIQTLHRYGFLSASLRPDADCVALRTLLRQRAPRLEPRAPHLLHRHKALLPMHLPWSQALRAVTGDTGQRIRRAMVAGERHPPPLAAVRHSRGTKEADARAR